MPKISYEKLEDVPEEFKAEAKAEDGKFVVDVALKSQVDEFRTRNIEVSQERDAFQNLIGRLSTDVEFDPDKIDEFVSSLGDLKAIKQQVDDGKLVKDTSLEEAIATRTKQMKTQHEDALKEVKNQLTNVSTERDTLKGEVNRSIIDREIMTTMSDPKLGIRPDATKAVLREAYDFYTVEDGRLVPKDDKGNIIYGADGTTPMGPKEFFTSRLTEAAPYLFKDSEGGGAGGGNGGGSLTSAQIASMSPEQKMDYQRSQDSGGAE